MKSFRYFTLILISLLGIELYAGRVLPTVENGKSWLYHNFSSLVLDNSDPEMMIGDADSRIYVERVIGDTIINGRHTKVLERYYIDEPTASGRSFMHDENGKVYLYTSLYSEDTDDKITDFYPIVDFSVKAGDLIENYQKIRSVETKNFHGFDRKVITFEGNHYAWIEGVGPSHDLSRMGNFEYPISMQTKLLACFDNDGCVFSEGDIEYGDNRLIAGPLRYDFEVDGKRYLILSEQDQEGSSMVALINNPVKRKFIAGSDNSLTLAGRIEHDGKVYTLSTIGNESLMMYGNRKVILPSTAQRIGIEAFMMSDIESVEGMENVRLIGSGAFKATPIKEFIYPAGIEYIGENPFAMCRNLRRIEFPKFGLKKAGKSIFGGNGVEEIIMHDVNPPAITEDMYFGGKNAAYPDSAIIRVRAESVDKYRKSPVWSGMADRIFPMDYNLDDAKLFYADGLFFSEFEANSGKVTTLLSPIKMYLPGRMDRYNAKSLSIPASVTLNGRKYEVTRISGFNNTPLEEVVLPASAECLGDAAFKNAPLTTLHGLPTITRLGEYSLAGTRLHDITFAEGLKELPKGVVSDCRALTILDLPSTIEEVGESVIAGCERLDTIICRAINPPKALPTSFAAEVGLRNEYRDRPVLVVPKGSSEKYAGNQQWSCFGKIVEMETTDLSGFTADAALTINVSNPTPGELEISVGDGGSYEVWTASGCRVACGREPRVALSPGLYIVRSGARSIKAVVR